MSKNIIITGFMGTGKTTVGREVARISGREFVDTDEIIEKQQGLSITDIFARHGEQHFREMESAVMTKLAQSNHAVIATGGGTLLSADMFETTTKTGIIFCLNADLPTLEARLHRDDKRPLLNTKDRRSTLQALWQRREKLYLRLPNHVDTTHQTPAEIATIIINRYTQLSGDKIDCR